MRHVVAPYQISALLQRGECRAHACFYVIHRIVPSGATRYLQCRTADLHAVLCKILHGSPHLLDFADAQLCLIKQYEMLVQVVVIIQHVAACRQFGVAPCPAGLLNIIFKRVGYVVMHNKPHIFLVNSHSEGRSCHYYAHPAAHKGFLIADLLIGIHLAVKRQSLQSVGSQLARKVDSALGARHIYYRRTVEFRHERPELQILVVVGFGIYYRIAQVGS